MSSNALIARENRPGEIAIWLHWNGDPPAVLAFLHACRDLGFRDPKEHDYGLAYLHAVIALYCGTGLSTGLTLIGKRDCPDDHGLYVLGPDYTIERRVAWDSCAGRECEEPVPEDEPEILIERGGKTFEELDDEGVHRYWAVKNAVMGQWMAAAALRRR
jgi:hypothetical protein